MGSERRGRAVQGRLEVNPSGEEPTDRPRQKNAELWEPYDGRLSRTVLREREGEVPSRHSSGHCVAAVSFSLQEIPSLRSEIVVRAEDHIHMIIRNLFEEPLFYITRDNQIIEEFWAMRFLRRRGAYLISDVNVVNGMEAVDLHESIKFGVRSVFAVVVATVLGQLRIPSVEQ